MSKLQKLELTWIGKGDEPKLEPRILIEDPAKSYGDPNSENILIHGDNLLALKALEQDYAGKIKCIYIDPPYNTGNAFEHYDDGVEHSMWLSLMKPRLDILKNLLSDDGLIWITLDDNEIHYFKVMCDEVFGRENFIGSVIWEKADSPRMDATFFSVRHDYIVVYGKSNKIFYKELDDKVPEHYNKKDDKGNVYYTKPLRVMGGNVSDSLYFPMVAPDGTEIFPLEPDGTKGCWRWSKRKVEEEPERIEWVKGKKGWTPYFRIYAENRRPTPAETIWKHEEVGSNRTSKNEIRALFKQDIFDTPKPEKLIKKILSISTKENDLVLDSFLGSGTTAAVAHKMKRRWIGIELGDHAVTHCLPRLQKVVNGADEGGITKAVNWKGGGGFKFYTLAPSLIQKDQYGGDIINPQYNANMLAAAMARQEGFRYRPDESSYWKQGRSSEKDFIFTTTQFVTVQLLDRLAEEMKEGESLLVCCKSFAKGCMKRHGNISIKKIPQMLLGRCEFGREDYSLNIIPGLSGLEDEQDGSPQERDTAGLSELEDEQDLKEQDEKNDKKAGKKKKKGGDDIQPSLF